MKSPLLLIFIVVLAVGAGRADGLPPTEEEKALLARSPAEYRARVLDPEIPRAFLVHSEGCPVCGKAINKFGQYSWIIDEDKPFKIQCPSCKNVFPDNDFEAYWKSGCKDKSLLKGKYVDDGRGWRPPQGGMKYWFVAYYHHWSFYNGNPIPKLAAAYQRTGNPEFARRGLAMLDRYAEFYPRYDYKSQSRMGEEFNPRYDGRILNKIWETGVVTGFAIAYAQMKPFLEKEDKELQRVTGKNASEIVDNIETNLLRVAANDIMTENFKIWGNFGSHQVTLLKIAAVLKDPAMVRWVTDFRTTRSAFSTPLDYAIYCNFYGDGAPMESPGYNAFWLDKIALVLQNLRENDVDVFARYPGVKRIFEYPSRLLVCNRFFPSSGDTGDLSARKSSIAGGKLTRQWAADALPSEANAGLLEVGVPSRTDPLFGYRSNLLSSFGMASLQNANPEHPTAMWMSWGCYAGHKHADALHVEMFAENAPLTPDFGYPDSASGDDSRRYALDENTLAHNTVVVDAKRQASEPGVLLHYDGGQAVQRISAEAPKVYPGMQKYRRTLLVCEVSPGKTVTFDLFRVRGGRQHDWFVHSAGESFSGNVKVSPPRKGTLAGENVKPGVMYDSPAHQGPPGTVSKFYDYKGSGYQSLGNVQSVVPDPCAMLEFPVKSGRGFYPVPGAALRLFPLPEAGETWFLSRGTPPATQQNPQKHLVFFTRRRMGKTPLESCFMTVWENVSSSNPPAVLRAEKVAPGAVKLFLANGGALYCFDSEETADFTCDDIHFSGKSGALLLDKAGKAVFAYSFGGGSILCNGEKLVESRPAFCAKIVSVDLKSEELTLDKALPAGCEGKMFRAGNFAYRISSADGSRVKLLEQSPIAGRFRLTGFDADSRKSGWVMPVLLLARRGMCIFDAEGKRCVGRLAETQTEGDRNRIAVTGQEDLKLGCDYWVGECGPGDIFILEDSQFRQIAPAGGEDSQADGNSLLVTREDALAREDGIALSSGDFEATGNVTGVDGVITAAGSALLTSRKWLQVDTTGRYTLSFSLRRTPGSEPATLYAGFIPADASRQAITEMQMFAMPEVTGNVSADVAAGDTVIQVRGPGTWRKGRQVAFFAARDLSDLPNRRIARIKEATRRGDGWQMVLEQPLGFPVPAGTLVRMHDGGEAYLYPLILKNNVSENWTEYSVTVTGSTSRNWDSGRWPRSTEFARVLILANPGKKNGSIEIRDVKFIVR